jgi:hypothetical protein
MENNIRSENDVRDELRALVKESGTVTKFAASIDYGAQYIYDVLAGRRNVSAELADKIGYTRVYAYTAQPDTFHIVPNAEDKRVPAQEAGADRDDYAWDAEREKSLED